MSAWARDRRSTACWESRPGTATESAHAQAVPARIETRGDVADYARAAAGALAPGGLFVCVHPAPRTDHARRAIEAAGLAVLRARDVVFKEGEPARVRLWAAMRARDLPEDLARSGGYEEPPLVIRTRDAARTPEYAAIRLSMGFPPG